MNNAGIFGPLGLVEALPENAYDQVLAINLHGMINVTKAFLPLIRKTEGRIVNTASVVGRLSLPVCAPYCISKHAVEAFSDCLR